MEKFKKFINNLLDYIYKKRCYFCGSNKEYVKMCSKCYEQLVFNEYSVDRNILGVKIYTAGVYEKNLQKMIRGLKYHHQKDLAYYQAKFMWEYFSQIIENEHLEKNFQVIPVPFTKHEKNNVDITTCNLLQKNFAN